MGDTGLVAVYMDMGKIKRLKLFLAELLNQWKENFSLF